ncbi:MAG TPA: RNA polymerase sigma factor [Rhizomicrobium sp.]|nr:RNA polymerase sigma factor [Rhizomicrobium sp.]
MDDRSDREDAALRRTSAAMNASEVDVWFVREVLPLEAALMQFLHHNWRNKSEIADLRQDIYERVCQAAQIQLPRQTKAFVFTTARNLLIDRVRAARIIPIEAAVDWETLNVAMDAPGPDRVILAREELRLLQAALDRLPPRCREAIVLKQIEGLTRREIAARMGVGEETVKMHLTNGMRALADILYGEPEDLRRNA